LSGGQKVVIQGTVRDSAGNPVKHAWMTVWAGSYVTTGSTAVIPIVTDRAVGAAVISAPDDVNIHNTHGGMKEFWADDDGHFQYKVDSGYEYRLQAFNGKFSGKDRKKKARAAGGSFGVEVKVNVPPSEKGPISADLVLHRW
jgi:hypothetical protein